MPKKPKKITISSLKKKAPKIPDYTCVSIDKVIDKLEKLVERKKSLDKKQLKRLNQTIRKVKNGQ